MNLRRIIPTALLVVASIALPAYAGPLEDGSLAGSAARLDQKGVELSLRKGAKANQALPHLDAPNVRRTPLQFALLALIENREPDDVLRAEGILRALFKSGAKLTGDQDELFPVISQGHIRILDMLLDQGANPHARLYGYTPAELAVKYQQTKLLPKLYARGVPKVDAETTAQIEFVHAASRQQLGNMRDALARGAKVNASDPAGSFGLVQLFTAPLREPDGYDAVKWLLFEAGGDPSVTELSDEKTTALHKVIARNSYNKIDHFTAAAIAEMLLQKGANVSSLDALGRTPLHYAARAGNIYAMRVLIGNGAKVMARDGRNRTPMDLAQSGEAISLLREAGAKE